MKTNDKRELWLKIHMGCCIAMMAATLVVEIAGMFILRAFNFLIHTTAEYLLYYVAIPMLLEGAGLVLTLILLKVFKSYEKRALTICLLYSYLSFIVYTIHLQYNSLCIGFAVAIMATIVYGDFAVTTITALVSVVLKIVSDVFIIWDYSYTTNRIGTATEKMDFLMSLVVLFITYSMAVLISRIEKEKQKVAVESEMEKIKYEKASLTDELTGIGNRKAFRLEMDRIQPGAGLALIDLDCFKEINDSYGHPVGDEYLKSLSQLLLQTEGATPYRFGGDEFTLIFQQAEPEDILKKCEALQKKFKEIKIIKDKTETISIGFSIHKENERISEFVERADKNLYRAKLERDTICHD